MVSEQENPAKIYIRNYGCAANIADGETISGCLSKSGYQIVPNEEEASILIYNTCAVKTQTENKVISALKNVPKHKRLIITGCLPLINLKRLSKEVQWHGLTGPSPGRIVVNVVDSVIKGEKSTLLYNDQKPSLTLPHGDSSRVVKIMPVCYGCLGTCTYCCVRFARGHLRSYTIEEIVDSVKDAIKSGFREIWLTAQDLACYGRDIDTDLVELLLNIDEIDGEFLVRLGMMNPANVMPILPELTNIFRSRRFFRFLHLPVQSGDDTVLKDMNRQYTSKAIREIVADIKERISQFTLATDFIYGFPTETDAAFKNSLSLLRNVKPDVINVSRFFPRPGTTASELAQLPLSVINDRGRTLSRLSVEISTGRNMEWVGWNGEVIVDERRQSNSLIARNFAYKPIVIKTNEDLLGKMAVVRVTGHHSSYLNGVLAHFE
ncbi:MAG TPA: tRNA (N(6)-L-threonylcarbamoyladenosine(37)-C(2))-methylthiotransferase [Candidatus Bathyarchaeia archaeon]|nr:MAG: hypothetical protein A3K70_03340 [Candidatus Bathyarchaeota archaeon RBG_16_48_13]HJX24356.1 tRNA (N(6)-L-threonylcarbamoyladenosine(37)-C(2))-methylthiotransferase [Candidatus Bathyarchaeia archaeon]